jgi:hypothetical protein
MSLPLIGNSWTGVKYTIKIQKKRLENRGRNDEQNKKELIKALFCLYTWIYQIFW